MLLLGVDVLVGVVGVVGVIAIVMFLLLLVLFIFWYYSAVLRFVLFLWVLLVFCSLGCTFLSALSCCCYI